MRLAGMQWAGTDAISSGNANTVPCIPEFGGLFVPGVLETGVRIISRLLNTSRASERTEALDLDG